MRKTLSYIFFTLAALLFGYLLLSGISYIARKNAEMAVSSFLTLVSENAQASSFEYNEDNSLTLRMSWDHSGPFVTCKDGAVIDYTLPYNVPLSKSGARAFCEKVS